MIRLNFQTITPLHISNGNQLAYSLEYILRDDAFAKLRMNNVSKTIAKAKLFDFNKDYGSFEIIKIIEANKNIFSDDDFEYKIDAIEMFTQFLHGENRDGQKIVQEFINSNGNFYIPGSSIKGMLTTILGRDPNNNPLGINPKNAAINDKFVITDSEYISAENFVVDRVTRPPEINLITLDIEAEFSSYIKSKGNLNINLLRDKLNKYSFNQIKKAQKFVIKHKNFEKKPGGATNYLNIIEKMLDEISLNEGTYLVNLGFGGGSYYKLFENAPIPKFPNPGRKGKHEEAHTTFNVNIDGELYQLGWCKLKIEED